MAKRKTGAAKRKAAGGSRSRSSGRKASPAGKRRAGRGARKTGKSAKKAARKATARRGVARKATARRAVTRKAVARKAGVRKSVAAKAPSPKRTVSRRPAAEKRAASPARSATPRKAPALNRPRRTVVDEDFVLQTPPSSLDLDRTASAVRSGRRGMKQRSDNLTQTGPALTGGDVDADWESAYSVGDEAPGGDNPTPDQDIVDDIGRAVGVEYEDNEELKGDEKIAKRDRKRWELDPASSEDYNDRD